MFSHGIKAPSPDDFRATYQVEVQISRLPLPLGLHLCFASGVFVGYQGLLKSSSFLHPACLEFWPSPLPFLRGHVHGNTPGR